MPSEDETPAPRNRHKLLTDDEIRVLIKPRHQWPVILGAIVGGVLLGLVIAQAIATTPTRYEFQQHSNEVTQVRLDMNTAKGHAELAKTAGERMEKAIEALNSKLDALVARRARRVDAPTPSP